MFIVPTQFHCFLEILVTEARFVAITVEGYPSMLCRIICVHVLFDKLLSVGGVK